MSAVQGRVDPDVFIGNKGGIPYVYREAVFMNRQTELVVPGALAPENR